MKISPLLIVTVSLLLGCSRLGEDSIATDFAESAANEYVECAYVQNLSCMDRAKISQTVINSHSVAGHTPLLTYLQNTRDIDLQVVRKFLEDGADPHNQSVAKYNSPYIFAIEADNIQLLRIYSQFGASPDFKYSSGLWTYPIHIAVTSRNLNALKFLLDNGAEIDTRNSAGDTPLLMTGGNKYESNHPIGTT